MLRFLLFLLLAPAILAGATPARAFEPTDLTLDPATGLEWLAVNESLGRSYDDLVGADGSDEFAPGGDFQGFRHATLAEAEAFLQNAGFDVLGAADAGLFDTALSLILRIGGPTFVSGGLDHVFAVTGSSTVTAGSRDRILISADADAGTGEAGANGALAEGAANGAHGHVLVREAAPLPDRWAFVARSGQAGIAVIDVATAAVIDTVNTGSRAVALALSGDQRRLYTLNLFDSTVNVIDTETRSVLATHLFATDGNPRDIEVSADGSQIFITDQVDPGFVVVLDADSGAEIDRVAVDRFPYGLTRSADGSEIYVLSGNTNEISVIDVASLTTVATSNASAVLFDADVAEGSGLIYSARSATVYEIDPDTLVSIDSVGVGADIRGVTVSERIGRVFASSNDDATLSVVDIGSFSVVATITTGTEELFPGILAPGVDVTAEGDRVYATQGYNDTVAVIDTLSNEVIAEIEAGDSPVDVVVVPEPVAGTLGATVLAALALLARRGRRF